MSDSALAACRSCGGLGYVGPCHCRIELDDEGDVHVIHDDQCEARCERCRGQCDLAVCGRCGRQDCEPSGDGCVLEVIDGYCDECLEVLHQRVSDGRKRA